MSENRVKSFTFYFDYYNLIDTLPINDKKELTIAILDYIFKDIEPILKGHNQAIFNTLKAQLNKSKNKSSCARKDETKENQNEIKSKSNENQMKIKQQSNRNQMKIKSDNKTSVLSFKFIISSFIEENNYSSKLETSLNEWLKYKQDIKNSYKSELGFNKLLTQIRNNIAKYGEQKVISLIDECIACGYKGIIFDKLKNNTINQESVPEWFNNIQEQKELSEEEKKELEALMKEFK